MTFTRKLIAVAFAAVAMFGLTQQSAGQHGLGHWRVERADRRGVAPQKDRHARSREGMLTGIVLNIVMLDEDDKLREMAKAIARQNLGRVFFVRPGQLGDALVEDYLMSKKEFVRFYAVGKSLVEEVSHPQVFLFRDFPFHEPHLQTLEGLLVRLLPEEVPPL